MRDLLEPIYSVTGGAVVGNVSQALFESYVADRQPVDFVPIPFSTLTQGEGGSSYTAHSSSPQVACKSTYWLSPATERHHVASDIARECVPGTCRRRTRLRTSSPKSNRLCQPLKTMEEGIVVTNLCWE
ncbi:hypothetical protein LY76DRAFT_165846 [Colletotrichum caudatum]|nr:hypothetical protein LY76DRAFT_165846 [Colletotrichum caudatum]